MARAHQRLEESRAFKMPRENNTMALVKIHSHRRVSLWSTHPSTEERVMRLQQYTG